MHLSSITNLAGKAGAAIINCCLLLGALEGLYCSHKLITDE